MKRLMASRRNFITILFVIAVVFFLFMFSGAAKDILNLYGQNSYAYNYDRTKNARSYMAEPDEGGGSSDEKASESAVDMETDDRGFVVCVGESGSISNTVERWCDMHHRSMEFHYRTAQLNIDTENPPVMLVVDGATMSADDIHIIMDINALGIPVVMASMPDSSVIEEDDDIRIFLGIDTLRAGEVELKGVSLYDGFLVGGGFDYDPVSEKQREELMDLLLEVPWYTTLAGTKTYMAGILYDDVYETLPEDEVSHYKNYSLPALVWRNRTENSYVFCVNADYMNDITGVGMLSAMEYEMSEYVIYPVVNAQSTVIVDFPSAAKENDEVMQRQYSRDSVSVERDIIWPDIAAIMERYDQKLTCMVSPKLDYSDGSEPDPATLIYFMKLFKETGAEAGISLTSEYSYSTKDKLTYDYDFLQKTIPEYMIQAAYVGEDDITRSCMQLERIGFKDVKAIVCAPNRNKRMMEYSVDGRIVLRVINEGDRHTFADDLRMRSIQTAMAYSLVMQDMKKVIYPESAEDDWQKVFDRYASYRDTFFGNFDLFEEVTASVAAKRADTFMGIDYAYSRSGNMVKVKSDRTGAYYLLRTHGEVISDVIGGSASSVDDDTYIIYVKNLSATVVLERKEVNPVY